MSLPRLFSLPKNTLVGAHTHFTKAGSILNRLLITLFLSLVYHRYSCYVIEGKNKLLSNTYMFISSVAQSCPTLQPHGLQHARLPCPSPTSRACSCPSTHVHRISDAIQPSHSLSSGSPPAFNLSQHQGHKKTAICNWDEGSCQKLTTWHRDFTLTPSLWDCEKKIPAVCKVSIILYFVIPAWED